MSSPGIDKPGRDSTTKIERLQQNGRKCWLDVNGSFLEPVHKLKHTKIYTRLYLQLYLLCLLITTLPGRKHADRMWGKGSHRFASSGSIWQWQTCPCCSITSRGMGSMLNPHSLGTEDVLRNRRPALRTPPRPHIHSY